MENTIDTEFVKTIAAIYPSQAVYDEIHRFIKENGRVAGRFFVQSALEKINREKKAGRWGV